MSSNTEKEVLINILELLREMPYIWNKNNENYSNKDLRNEGFKILLENYKKIDRNASIKTLKKKLDIMRTNFYKEFNKVKAYKQTGAETQNVYVPSLWYFDAYSFLDNTDDPYRTKKDNEDSLSAEDKASEGDTSGTSKYEPLKKKLKKPNDVLAAELVMTMKEDDADIYGKAIGVHLRKLKKDQLEIARKLISDIIFYATRERLTDQTKVNISN